MTIAHGRYRAEEGVSWVLESVVTTERGVEAPPREDHRSPYHIHQPVGGEEDVPP